MVVHSSASPARRPVHRAQLGAQLREPAVVVAALAAAVLDPAAVATPCAASCNRMPSTCRAPRRRPFPAHEQLRHAQIRLRLAVRGFRGLVVVLVLVLLRSTSRAERVDLAIEQSCRRVETRPYPTRWQVATTRLSSPSPTGSARLASTSPACVTGGRCVSVKVDGADLEVRAQEQSVDEGGRAAEALPVVIPHRGDEP